MNKLKLSIALDGAFIFGISFFIYYAIVKQNIYSIISATIFSVTLSSLTAFLFILISSYKNRKKVDTAIENEKVTAFSNRLYLLKDSEVVLLISSYLNKVGKPYEVKKSAFYFKDKKVALYFDFTPDKTTLSTAIRFYKQTPKGYKTAILCCEYNAGVKEFFSEIDSVSIYTAYDLYSALNSEKLLPDYPVKEKKAFSVNKLIGRFLRRENVKKFFLWGAVLTLFSTVTYYKFFYAFLGTVFLLIAVYLKFFKTKT